MIARRLLLCSTYLVSPPPPSICLHRLFFSFLVFLFFFTAHMRENAQIFLKICCFPSAGFPFESPVFMGKRKCCSGQNPVCPTYTTIPRLFPSFIRRRNVSNAKRGPSSSSSFLLLPTSCSILFLLLLLLPALCKEKGTEGRKNTRISYIVHICRKIRDNMMTKIR